MKYTLMLIICVATTSITPIRGQTLTLHGSSSSTVVGESFNFTCKTSGGDSQDGLLYFIRGRLTICSVKMSSCSEFNTSSGYSCGCLSGQTGGFYLNISSVSPDDDDDNWTCQVSDFSSNSVSLNVFYLFPPNLTISSPQVKENDSVQVVCNVTSNPTAQMTIKNMENDIILVDKEETNSRLFIIEKAHCLQNGTYQCLTYNRDLDKTETTSESLHVLCSPRADHRRPLKQELVRDIGETATMTADVLANPPPTFTWWRFLDDQLEPILNKTVHDIKSTDLQSTLQVTVNDVKDYGTYALETNNDIGRTILLYTLSRVIAPLTPDEFSVVNITASTATLQWKSNNNGGSEQTFSVDYRTEDSDWVSWRTGVSDPGRGTLVKVKITGLTQTTKYLLQVYATNRHGTSSKVIKEVTTTSSTAEDHLGQGVGIGLGITLPVILILSLLVLFLYRKKRHIFKKGFSTGCHTQKSTIEMGVIPNVSTAGMPCYEGLEDSVSVFYEPIESSVNMKKPQVTQTPDGPYYEEMEESASASRKPRKNHAETRVTKKQGKLQDVSTVEMTYYERLQKPETVSYEPIETSKKLTKTQPTQKPDGPFYEEMEEYVSASRKPVGSAAKFAETGVTKKQDVPLSDESMPVPPRPVPLSVNIGKKQDVSTVEKNCCKGLEEPAKVSYEPIEQQVSDYETPVTKEQVSFYEEVQPRIQTS